MLDFTVSAVEKKLTSYLVQFRIFTSPDYFILKSKHRKIHSPSWDPSTVLGHKLAALAAVTDDSFVS
jgi:hypothetical protein